MRFADIFPSPHNINVLEVKLKDQLLRHSDTVYRQVFTLLPQ
jgi:hypothetical protein